MSRRVARALTAVLLCSCANRLSANSELETLIDRQPTRALLPLTVPDPFQLLTISIQEGPAAANDPVALQATFSVPGGGDVFTVCASYDEAALSCGSDSATGTVERDSRTVIVAVECSTDQCSTEPAVWLPAFGSTTPSVEEVSRYLRDNG